MTVENIKWTKDGVLGNSVHIKWLCSLDSFRDRWKYKECSTCTQGTTCTTCTLSIIVTTSNTDRNYTAGTKGTTYHTGTTGSGCTTFTTHIKY